MFRALVFKEWIKLRLYWTLMCLAHFLFCVYLCLQLRHAFKLHDALSVWSNWVFKGYLFFKSDKNIPLLLGVVLGCLQFFPEILNKKLRLVLHLPMPEERAVGVHLVAGLFLLTLALLPGLLLLAVCGAIYFPREFLLNFGFIYLPWFLGGYAAYLLTAFTLVEPTWRLRITCLLFSAALLKLFYLDSFYDGWRRLLPGMALLTLALFLLPLLSANRFSKGYGS
jgi:hypothetical protein